MQAETWINVSRSRSGPDPETAPLAAHGVRYVERDGSRFKATCRCGWNKRRKAAALAREALAMHILAQS